MAGSCIPAVKAYLFGTVLPTLFPEPVLVSYGMPGSFEPQDIVTVGNARAGDAVPVMNPNRPIEETVEVDVAFSCFRPGGPEAQQNATEAAFAMVSTFRDHFKGHGNETLGGACRTARVTSTELFEDDDPDAVADGRLAQVLVTLTIRARN